MKPAFVPAAVFAFAWPLLLVAGPGCPIRLPPPAPAPAMSATATLTSPAARASSGSVPAAVSATSVPPLPELSETIARPAPATSPPRARAERHRQAGHESAAAAGRGNPLLSAQGGRRRSLPVIVLLLVVLAPCTAAAITRYARNRLGQ
ncbi:MAG TPA: hypothetical protein VG142_12485 [Trebonia sp.]|nr:hypothetical protein [Trebonia sp.]